MSDVPESLRRLVTLASPVTWFSRKKTTSRPILQRLTGSIREGEMLMIVGRPGSGCTTVLKALSNMRDEYLGLEGDVWYGSMDAPTARRLRPNQVAFLGMRVSHAPIETCTS